MTQTEPPVMLRALDLDVEVLAPTPDLADQVRVEWARCTPTSVPPASDRPSKSEPAVVRLAGDDPQAAGYRLASNITSRAITNLRGRRVMLHACAVADEAGRVLTLVAPSGTGKTTAARVLSRDAGLGYVTDETVAVDADGAVMLYPKPLSFVDDERLGGPKVQHSPDALGLGVPPRQLVLSRLVILRRHADPAAAPRLERLGLLDGVLALIAQTSALAIMELPLQRLCSLVDRSGGVFELHYSEIAEAAKLLTEFLVDDDREPDDWEPLQDAPGDRHSRLWALRDDRLRRRPVADAVRIGDEALVMVGDRPVRLTGLGFTVWEAAGSAPSPPELESAVVGAHGEHPHAARIIEDTVAGMAAAELVARRAPVSMGRIAAGRVGSMLP